MWRSPGVKNSPYSVWANFKRYVLDVAAKQLTVPAVDFPFTYEPVKTGKKTTAVKFTLPDYVRGGAVKQLSAASAPVVAPAPTAAPVPATGNQMLDTYYVGLVSNWGLVEWQIKVLNAYFTQENADGKLRFANVKELICRLNKGDAKGPLGVYTWGCLTKKFPALDHIHLKLYPAQSSH